MQRQLERSDSRPARSRAVHDDPREVRVRLYADAQEVHHKRVRHARRHLSVLRHRIRALEREYRANVRELETLEREELPYAEALAMTA